MKEPITEADGQVLQKAVDMLSEHFDNVQIFVSRQEDGTRNRSTSFSVRGIGNYFARYGQVKRWLMMSEETDRQMAREGQA